MLTSWYEKIVNKPQCQFVEMVRVEVLTCAKDEFNNTRMLHGSLDNEAELRFAYGNPIVSILCSIHEYFLNAEDKLRTPKIGTTRHNSMANADKITEKVQPIISIVLFTILI